MRRVSRVRLLFTSLLIFCAGLTTSLPAQTFTTLATFIGSNGDSPEGPLAQGADGNFYGTTFSGGANFNCQGYSCGTIFRITPSGTVTIFYNFCFQPNCADGSNPSAGLLLGVDGNFYGTTSNYFSTGTVYGTVFRISPTGVLTTLHTFNGADGNLPAKLVQATDGNFYGTTFSGGANNGCQPGGCGTVFKITPSGMLTTLYNFCAQPNCADGSNPIAGLALGADGDLYGTTYYGGGSSQYCTYGCGTIFKITPSGAFTILHNFCSVASCQDGDSPDGELVQAADGNFYGVAGNGGVNFTGTIYKITPGGAFTTLYSFCPQGCSDGVFPAAGLIQATDGNFYGTTGGFVGTCSPPDCGTIFKITPSGVLTTFYSFTNRLDGNHPAAALLQGTDGKFYGTTAMGGGNGFGHGTVFSLSTGLAPFVEAQPTSGTSGSPVTILGTNLFGASSVTFNGSPATIITNTGSAITTTVPSAATTGVIQVITPGGTLTSNADFQVLGPIQFVPVTPCRLVDTRLTHNPILGGTSQSFVIPQLGGCGIPNNAAAYSLSVAVVPRGRLDYLTLWPSGEIQPYVATTNSLDGRIKGNAAIVPSGNNAVSVYATDTTDVILDINGYFATPGPNTYQFYPLTPCRLVDTRNNQDGGTLQKGMERDYLVAGHCGIPSNAAAYSFNVAVLPAPGGLDYLTVWPQGETRPYVSTLNDYTGTIVANAAIVPAGANDTTAFYPDNNNTDLVVDVNGYFAPAGAGGLSLYAVTPCRVLDTRNNNGQGFVGTIAVDVVDSPCAPPSGAQSYVLNATVVPPGPMLYLTLWPHGETQPNVSTLNAQDGAITSNMAIVSTNDGSIDAYAYALTQLVLDISGYFAP